MIAVNGNCELYYETFGDPAGPTLLLVNGLGSQCINFAAPWCEMFAARGFHVVRFDNRDVGYSTSFADARSDAAGAAYRLSDMAADAVAVLDALGVERAHVVGVSMGGMIAQTLAIERPDRLASLTSVMSSTGEPEYGRPTPEAFALLTAPPPTDRESYVARAVAGLRVWGTPEFADEARWRADAELAWDRGIVPGGSLRQFLAVGASGPRADGLRGVDVPALVIHGGRDTLIDPSGGRRTAELIPAARFALIDGMGHDYPPQLWPRWVDLIAAHASAA